MRSMILFFQRLESRKKDWKSNAFVDVEVFSNVCNSGEGALRTGNISYPMDSLSQ